MIEKTIRIASFAILSILLFPASGSDAAETYGDLEILTDMIDPRYNHTATTLDENRILVSGGTSDGYDSMASCEILDVSSGIWHSTDPLEENRMRHAAICLDNGSVLVTGGYVGGGHPSLFRHYRGEGNRSLSSSEIYHQNGMKWSSFPPMRQGRFWHEMIDHPDLGILVIGGLNITGGAISSCERFNGDSFEKFPPLPEPRARFALAVLDDGDILVAGGHDGIAKKAVNTVFRYDLESDRWVNSTPMLHSRGYPGYLMLEDGRFVVSGGFSEPGLPDRSDSEYYDQNDARWYDLGPLLFPRHGHGMAEIPGECVVIAGGSNCQTGGCHSNLEVFDEEKEEWVDSGHLIMGRKWCTLTAAGERSLIMIGGRACNYPTADTEHLRFQPGNEKTKDQRSATDPVDWAFIATVLVLTLLLSFIVNKWRKT